MSEIKKVWVCDEIRDTKSKYKYIAHIFQIVPLSQVKNTANVKPYKLDEGKQFLLEHILTNLDLKYQDFIQNNTCYIVDGSEQNVEFKISKEDYYTSLMCGALDDILIGILFENKYVRVET